MDFEIATRRLAKDQQSALVRSRAAKDSRIASTKAKREAAEGRANTEKRLKEKKLDSERKIKIINSVTNRLLKLERQLGVVDIGGSLTGIDNANLQTNSVAKNGNLDIAFEKNPLASGWKLSSTSIYGEGDKISLPPSVLETLTSGNIPGVDPWNSQHNGRPLAFRIGVLNSDYTGFPSSDKMVAILKKMKEDIISSENFLLSSTSNEHDDRTKERNDQDDIDSGDDEGESFSLYKEAYLDELSHRYLSYTHGTVVEFTQDNGFVGLPQPIAQALLNPNSFSLVGDRINNERRQIIRKRTTDLASLDTAKKEASSDDKSTENSLQIESMDTTHDFDASENTPGHPAYGKFDIPASQIEVIPITLLPPGKECTLIPTPSSVRNGFYSLKDVKVVLEQSLIRTRATLSKGDTVRTWRRGVSFDLIVSELSPTAFGAVSCVNTDLNVDIGPAKGIENEIVPAAEPNSESHYAKSAVLSNEIKPDRLQSETSSQATILSQLQSSFLSRLPSEPPDNVTKGVCIIQIRCRGRSDAPRRRFDVATATMADLFLFASYVCGEEFSSTYKFCLVTRFPRKVYRIVYPDVHTEDVNGLYRAEHTLEMAGIQEGQEQFIIEQI